MRYKPAPLPRLIDPRTGAYIGAEFAKLERHTHSFVDLDDVSAASPDEGDVLYFDGAEWARTSAVTLSPAGGALRIRKTPSGDGLLEFYDDTGGTLRAEIATRHSNNRLNIRNHINGGEIVVTATNSSGTSRTLFAGNPDGAATLYYAGSPRLQTHSGGVYIPISAFGGLVVEREGAAEGGVDFKVGSGNKPGVRFRIGNPDVGSALNNTAVRIHYLEDSTFIHQWITMKYNGGVQLYHVNALRLETTDTGVTVTGTVNETSDARLKSDRRPLSSALSKVRALKGERYRMLERETAGLIAQDVQAAMPEAVSTITGEDGEEYLTYAPSVVLAYVVEAVKELGDRIEALEAKGETRDPTDAERHPEPTERTD